MAAQRITISVPETAADVLSRTGNASQYITSAVEARWHQWQQALGHLLSRGWDYASLGATMRSLHGVNRVERGLFSVARAMLAEEDMSDQDVAAALVLAEEWWMGNQELRRILNRVPRKRIVAPPETAQAQVA